MRLSKRFRLTGIGLGLVTAISTHALAQTANEREQGEANTQKASAQKESAQAKTQNAKQEPVVLTVTTVAFAESTGCWAKIHDGENYTGRTLTFMGQQSLPNLEFGIGNDWEGDIDSIQVGPKATLTLYDDENYTDDKRELGPNARVANLHQALFDEGIESLKVTCGNGAAR